ncbi:hypothetical protein HYPSUDRAFT_209025 [Hypholoma sublateritium FD-334 SS-4]|uniref:Uncharacterized protein n=1 Tax=Hypholoma sublateritium (strain FD-334 SS-4) TaxID=945553 RepID=A0A0D2NBV5_HYPSF|nr:hypothetical protein HYPSUDRAFT_209025 [Hypholoma sublateritium FD-334 SS-4]
MPPRPPAYNGPLQPAWPAGSSRGSRLNPARVSTPTRRRRSTAAASAHPETAAPPRVALDVSRRSPPSQPRRRPPPRGQSQSHVAESPAPPAYAHCSQRVSALPVAWTWPPASPSSPSPPHTPPMPPPQPIQLQSSPCSWRSSTRSAPPPPQPMLLVSCMIHGQLPK